MKMFSEYYNVLLMKTIEVINRIYNKEKFSRKQLEDYYNEDSINDSAIISTFVDSLIEQNNGKESMDIFYLDSKDNVNLRIPSGINIKPYFTELIWLWNILKDPKSKLFFDDLSREKIINFIEKNCKSIIDFSKFIDVKNNDFGYDNVNDPEFIKKFRTIIKAIMEKRTISFSNIDFMGNSYKNTDVVPYRIEYSVLDRIFRVSMWLTEENRQFKANLSRMSDIIICDKKKVHFFDSMEKMMDNRKAMEPIIVGFKNDKNSIERAAWLFSSYDRNSYYNEEGMFVLKLNYYVFDEQIIIQNILSFGINAKVYGPERIIQKIKSQIQYGFEC